MRSPLTETIYKVQGMITYARENLSTDEYMLFLDLLVPEPDPEPEAVKTVKKKRKPRTRSPRAASLAEQIKGAGRPPAAAGVPCAHTETVNNGSNIICAELEDNPIHDPAMGYAGYHPFVAPSTAPAARSRSSVGNGEGFIIPSSEGETVSAGGVAGGSNERT